MLERASQIVSGIESATLQVEHTSPSLIVTHHPFSTVQLKHLDT